jgi:hypothetical protein
MTAALGQKAKSHQSLSPSLATRDEQCQHTPQIRCSGAQTLLQRRSRCDGRGELSEAVACARANDAGCICIMLTNKHCHASINARALRPPALTTNDVVDASAAPFGAASRELHGIQASMPSRAWQSRACCAHIPPNSPSTARSARPFREP